MCAVAEWLSKNGFRTVIVVARGDGPYRYKIPGTIGFEDLQAGRIWYSVFGLRRHIERFSPDLIISAGTVTNCLTSVALSLTRAAPVHIATQHTDVTADASHNDRRIAKLLPWFVRFTYSKAACIVAVSKGVGEDLVVNMGVEEDKVRTIYNPVFNNSLVEMSEKAPRKDVVGNYTGSWIVAVGRLTQAKDFETLIDAFYIVRENHESRLLILGEGELRGDLERQVQSLGLTESVVMPGFLENPYPYIRLAEVLVSTSRWEGFGNVIVEALAFDTQVVATDCRSGPAEILENGRYGWLVPVGDAQEVADAIIMVLKGKRKEGGRSRAEAFRVERVLSQYGEAIEGVLS